MGIDNFAIRLNKPSGVYYAGETLSGNVQFITTKPYNSDGVFIKYIGRADVNWTEGYKGNTDNRSGPGQEAAVPYEAYEVYIDKLELLYSPPDGKLTANKYSLPFSIKLPPHIPSSFTGSVGKIVYQVRADVHLSGIHTAASVTLPFTVLGVKDLKFEVHLHNPVAMSNNKTFSTMYHDKSLGAVSVWRKSKPIIAHLSINKQGFVSGEDILVSGVINNESDVDIKECELKLIETAQYRVGGGKKSEKITAYKCTQPAIDKESKAIWDNVPITVPCIPPSGLDGCSIITNSYSVLIRIIPCGVHFALELSCDITIGTIPFQEETVSLPIPPPSEAGYAHLTTPEASKDGYDPAPPGLPSGYPAPLSKSLPPLPVPVPSRPLSLPPLPGSKVFKVNRNAQRSSESAQTEGSREKTPIPGALIVPSAYVYLRGVKLRGVNKPKSYQSIHKTSTNKRDEDDDQASYVSEYNNSPRSIRTFC
ncbi:arrestin domain-containing protein 1-like [Bolinopsis microptera]|uniref:arrestin domain-containing protein 1-like n=1 Tax=Bolinopsis microptera TaxID=2820187 RepID=UPI00307A2838